MLSNFFEWFLNMSDPQAIAFFTMIGVPLIAIGAGIIASVLWGVWAGLGVGVMGLGCICVAVAWMVSLT